MQHHFLEKIVDEIISASGAVTIADMGRVMAQVMTRVGPSADGSTVSAIVKPKLSK